jgi:hypothetical protein
MQSPDFLKPLIDLLPPDARPFFTNGGWLIPFAVIGFIFLLIAWSLLKRLFAKRRAVSTEMDLTEDLGAYPIPPALWGTRRLTLHGLPVRIRLVVAAPLGHEGRYVHADQMERLLDQIVPGLSHFLNADKPRVVVWPTQLSAQGFAAAFRRNAQRPDPDKPLSRWVLVMGRGLVDRRPLVFGFAMLADKDNTLGRVELQHPHQWMEVLRLVG